MVRTRKGGRRETGAQAGVEGKWREIDFSSSTLQILNPRDLPRNTL